MQDANGATTTYGYDALDRLTSVTAPGTNASYTYNGAGDRVGKTVNGATTNYTVDGGENLAESTGGTSTEYVYGAGLIAAFQGSTASYPLTDALGSVRLITDSSGNQLSAATYDAYGNVRSSSGTQLSVGYTGQQQDPENGLVYLHARSYDPTTGRFLSTDPLDGTSYGYAAGNPLSYTDPSGLCFTPTDPAAGGPSGDSSFGGAPSGPSGSSPVGSAGSGNGASGAGGAGEPGGPAYPGGGAGPALPFGGFGGGHPFGAGPVMSLPADAASPAVVLGAGLTCEAVTGLSCTGVIVAVAVVVTVAVVAPHVADGINALIHQWQDFQARFPKARVGDGKDPGKKDQCEWLAEQYQNATSKDEAESWYQIMKVRGCQQKQRRGSK